MMMSCGPINANFISISTTYANYTNITGDNDWEWVGGGSSPNRCCTLLSLNWEQCMDGGGHNYRNLVSRVLYLASVIIGRPMRPIPGWALACNFVIIPPQWMAI